MPINFPTIKLFIFINKLFTNNKDFSFWLVLGIKANSYYIRQVALI